MLSDGKLREIIVTLLKGGPDREGGIGRNSKNTVIYATSPSRPQPKHAEKVYAYIKKGIMLSNFVFKRMEVFISSVIQEWIAQKLGNCSVHI